MTAQSGLILVTPTAALGIRENTKTRNTRKAEQHKRLQLIISLRGLRVKT